MEFTPDRELTHLKSVFAHEFFDGTYSRQGIETFVFPVEIFNVGMELTPDRELKRVIPDSVLIFLRWNLLLSGIAILYRIHFSVFHLDIFPV